MSAESATTDSCWKLQPHITKYRDILQRLANTSLCDVPNKLTEVPGGRMLPDACFILWVSISSSFPCCLFSGIQDTSHVSWSIQLLDFQFYLLWILLFILLTVKGWYLLLVARCFLMAVKVIWGRSCFLIQFVTLYLFYGEIENSNTCSCFWKVYFDFCHLLNWWYDFFLHFFWLLVPILLLLGLLPVAFWVNSFFIHYLQYFS